MPNRLKANLAAIALAVTMGAGGVGSAVQRPPSFEALRAEIEALRPANHPWRAIAWKACPLAALTEAREKNRPVLAWVFLGSPIDERC